MQMVEEDAEIHISVWTSWNLVNYLVCLSTKVERMLVLIAVSSALNNEKRVLYESKKK